MEKSFYIVDFSKRESSRVDFDLLKAGHAAEYIIEIDGLKKFSFLTTGPSKGTLKIFPMMGGVGPEDVGKNILIGVPKVDADGTVIEVGSEEPDFKIGVS